MFIPLLPAKLISYASVAAPFVLGVRRYMVSQLGQGHVVDVVVVDLDKGELKVSE